MPARPDPTFWSFIAVLVLLHLALHVALGLDVDRPDLIAAAVLLAARRVSGPRAAVIALLLGLLADAFSLIAFGASAVAFVVVAWIGSRSRDLFEGSSLAFTALYLFVGKWLADVIYLLVAPSGRASRHWPELYTAAPLRALYTALAGVVLLALFRAIAGDRRGR